MIQIILSYLLCCEPAHMEVKDILSQEEHNVSLLATSR
jgi:hypothetical protein